MKVNRYLTINLSFLILSLSLLACKQRLEKKASSPEIKEFKYFSKNVKDTFTISVQLPLAFQQHPERKYPVVVLTDANFYFPMLAPVLHQYEVGGLLPPLILVGIGYKSFPIMNSLRVRDDLYPAAIPSDEMKAPGGGKMFYQFITKELLPEINAKYPSQQNNRTLLGHSFGGYFSLFSLLEQINNSRDDFSGFVSASPSLWYNNFYLNQLPQKLIKYPIKDTLNIVLTVGGAEEKQWSVEPVKKLSGQFGKLNLPRIKFSNEIYNNLTHMDVGLLSFTRGLELIYNKSK